MKKNSRWPFFVQLQTQMAMEWSKRNCLSFWPFWSHFSCIWFQMFVLFVDCSFWRLCFKICSEFDQGWDLRSGHMQLWCLGRHALHSSFFFGSILLSHFAATESELLHKHSYHSLMAPFMMRSDELFSAGWRKKKLCEAILSHPEAIATRIYIVALWCFCWKLHFGPNSKYMGDPSANEPPRTFLSWFFLVCWLCFFHSIPF